MFLLLYTGTKGLESEEGVSENTKQNRSQRRISKLRASAMLYKMKQESCEQAVNACQDLGIFYYLLELHSSVFDIIKSFPEKYTL